MTALYQTSDINTRRELVLQSLMLCLGEDDKFLLKDYLDCQVEKAEQDMERMTLGILVIRKEIDELFSSLADVGIIIDGVEVMNELSSVASACAILFGLIYTLNLSYPNELKVTFEVFQKIFMQLDV